MATLMAPSARPDSQYRRRLGPSLVLVGYLATVACGRGAISEPRGRGFVAGSGGGSSGEGGAPGIGGTGFETGGASGGAGGGAEGGAGGGPTAGAGGAGGRGTGGAASGGIGGSGNGGTGGTKPGGSGGTTTGGTGGTHTGGTGGTTTGGTGGSTTGGTGGTTTGGTGGTTTGGTGGTTTGGTGGTATGGSGGTTILFDDFLGSSLDTTKWSVIDRIGDTTFNHELHCTVPANVSVSSGFLNGLTKHEDHTCGDSLLAPTLMHYTSWQIQQKTAPFLYGTVEVRAKPPGGIGIWPTIFLLGYKWQAGQLATANDPTSNWPHDGWCETDMAEFLGNHRTQMNCVVHFEVFGGTSEQALPFDATTRYMVYRLQWSASSLVWSVNAEDGAGFRTLRTITGAGNVPNVAMYLTINAAVGGIGGGTPDPATFPQTYSIDWVRITH